MYNKLKFNNLFISSKKQIEKGRAQVIQKCVQKVRKLKILTEKNPQNKRHEQSLRKTIMYIEQLKKLKAIHVIKGVLLMHKPATAVLTNGRATVEEVVEAMLSMNKIIQVIVERFKVELNLDANEQSWRKQLQETSKRRAKIERTEEKRRRRREQKDQKSVSRKRQQWLEEHNTLQNEETPNTTISTNGIWKEEIIEDEIPATPISTTKLQNKRKTIAKENVLNKNKQPKTMDGPKAEPIQKAHSLTAQPKYLSVSVTKEEEPMKKDQDEETTHVIDSFFITQTGENYLSSAIVKNNYPDEKNDHVGRDYGKDRTKTIIGLHRKHNDFIHANNDARHTNLKFNGDMQYTQRHRVQIRTQEADSGENKLHPSWAAKQRFKPIIGDFQGKRITFDEENIPKQKKMQKTESIAEKLHPSWVAKQKLKPVITAFQGKKITFE